MSSNIRVFQVVLKYGKIQKSGEALTVEPTIFSKVWKRTGVPTNFAMF